MKSVNSKFSIGTANFDNAYGLNQKKFSKKKIKELVSFLRKKNITHLDTAISYGNTQKFLGENDLKRFNVTSKINIRNVNINNLEKYIYRKLRITLKELKIKKLFALLLHDEDELQNLKKSKIFFKILKKLKKRKLIKYYGISIYKIQKLKKYYSRNKFDIVQMPYNIFDRRLNDKSILKFIKKNKIKVFVRSIFFKGLILSESNYLNNRKIMDIKINLKKWLNKKKISNTEACVRFLFNNKVIYKIVVGISSLTQLKEILKYTKKNKLNIPEEFTFKNSYYLDPRNW